MAKKRKNPFLSWIAKGYKKDQVWIPWVNIPIQEDKKEVPLALEWTVENKPMSTPPYNPTTPIKPKVFSATADNPVVDKDKVLGWEVDNTPYDFDKFIKNKNRYKSLTKEEQDLFKDEADRIKYSGQWVKGYYDSQSGNIQTAPTTEDTIKPLSQQTDRDIARIEETKQRQLKESADIATQDTEREVLRIRERGERAKETLQRSLSLRGVGRSSLATDKIWDMQSDIDSMVSTAERKYQLEQELRDAQIRGVAGEQIQGLQDSLAQAKNVLAQQLQENLEKQQEVNAEMNKSFAESMDSLFSTIQASGDDLPEYDDKASKALWYISDKNWNPLKLDKDGNPIAPKNDFGQDVKITTFKDSNGNTYIYENWFKKNVITNQWEIREWTDDIVVPKQVKDDQKESKRRDLETQLRKEYIKRPEVSRFQDIRGNFTRIEKAKQANTWPWDVAMVFSFMKMLDPWSVVREWEYATAENTWWVDDKIRNTYNKLLNWERLTPDQRTNFYDIAQSLFSSEVENVKSITDSYKKIIEDAGWRPDYVFVWGEMDLWLDKIEFDEFENWEFNELEKSFSWWEKSGNTFEIWGFTIDLSSFNNPDQTGGTKDFKEKMDVSRTWTNVAKDTLNPWNITADSIPAWISKEEYWKEIWAIWTYLSPNGREYFVFPNIKAWWEALKRDIIAKQTWNSRNIRPNDTLERFQRVYVWEVSPWYLAVLERITWKNKKTKIKDVDSDLLVQAVMKAEWFNS